MNSDLEKVILTETQSNLSKCLLESRQFQSDHVVLKTPPVVKDGVDLKESLSDDQKVDPEGAETCGKLEDTISAGKRLDAWEEGIPFKEVIADDQEALKVFDGGDSENETTGHENICSTGVPLSTNAGPTIGGGSSAASGGESGATKFITIFHWSISFYICWPYCWGRVVGSIWW